MNLIYANLIFERRNCYYLRRALMAQNSGKQRKSKPKCNVQVFMPILIHKSYCLLYQNQVSCDKRIIPIEASQVTVLI